MWLHTAGARIGYTCSLRHRHVPPPPPRNLTRALMVSVPVVHCCQPASLKASACGHPVISSQHGKSAYVSPWVLHREVGRAEPSLEALAGNAPPRSCRWLVEGREWQVLLPSWLAARARLRTSGLLSHPCAHGWLRSSPRQKSSAIFNSLHSTS